MINKIKKVHKRVLDKKGLINKLSLEFGVSEGTVKSNWFSNWNINVNYQEKIYNIVIDWVKNETTITIKIIK